jgi:hypothetical protein
MVFTKRAIFFFFLFTAFIRPSHAEVEAQLWLTTKSQHFIAYYQEAPDGYIDELINSAEKYYNSIVDELGYRRFDFWSWDNRAKIYMYKDNASYHSDLQSAGWSGATVDVRKRTIRTFVGQGGFFDSVLPHEMTHIIFREFVGYKINLPLWMDEGVACSQEKSSLQERLKVAKNLVNQAINIDLNRLTKIQGATLVIPQVFYAQAASVIVFLLDNYGREKFLEFSRALRDKENWQGALEEAYGFGDLNDMDKKWKEYVLSH